MFLPRLAHSDDVPVPPFGTEECNQQAALFDNGLLAHQEHGDRADQGGDDLGRLNQVFVKAGRRATAQPLRAGIRAQGHQG